MAKTPKRRPRSGQLKAAAVQDVYVRARIVQMRKDRGLTAKEVASRMGVSRPFYTQLENGSRRLSLVYFLAICRALPVKPGELLK